MSKNAISEYNHTTVLRDVHNEEQQALDIIVANDLVPVKYGKVTFEYITSGNGEGEVGQIDFHSEGQYQTTKLIPLADKLGSAHKTTIYFIDRTAASLAGKAFIIYDNAGAVAVWYNMDGLNTQPNVDIATRYIQVNILSTDNYMVIAEKTSQTIHADSQFLSVVTSYIVIISSSSVGLKPNSVDFNSSLVISNKEGSQYISLNSKYFYINSALNADLYYVWYNVAGTGVDPAIIGRTGIMVAIPSGASKDVVAQNTKTSLDSTGKFITNILDGDLTIKNKLIGLSIDTQDINTGFYINTIKSGENREIIATVIMEYDTDCNVISVERL